MKKRWIFYSTLITGIVLLDRLTKWWALSVCALRPLVINTYVSFFVAYNRGMAWSLAASHDDRIFFVVTIVVLCMTLLIAYMAYYRHYKQHKTIFGECVVIAGSLGNLYDRCTVGGVIDFIECCYADWCWPVFNIADMAVVIGVGIMVYCYKKELV